MQYVGQLFLLTTFHSAAFSATGHFSCCHVASPLEE